MYSPIGDAAIYFNPRTPRGVRPFVLAGVADEL